MTRRRLTTVVIVVAAAGAMFSLATIGGLMHTCRRGGGSSAARSMERLWVGPAAAQEVMEFKPVPRESVPDEDAPRARRRASATAPASPTPPEPPSTPSPIPAVPAPEPVPDVTVGHTGDVVRFGSNIHIHSGQRVTGAVVAMGGDVTVDGHVEGDVVAVGGDVSLGAGGIVDGQVVTVGGHLHETPGSHVGGQRVSAGALPRGMFPAPFFGLMGLVGSGLKAVWSIAKMFVLLLIAWGVTQLAPQRTRTAWEAVKSEPLMCLGIGLLAWALIIPSFIAMVLVFVILCITIIGIPLALALLVGYGLALMLLAVWGYVVGAVALGERLARQLGRNLTSLTLMAAWGIAAVTVIRVVGYMFGGLPMGGFPGGMLILLSAVLGGALVTLGAGALLRTQWRRDTLANLWPRTRATAAPEAGPVPASPAPASPASSGAAPAADPAPSAPPSSPWPEPPPGEPPTTPPPPTF